MYKNKDIFTRHFRYALLLNLFTYSSSLISSYVYTLFNKIHNTNVLCLI